MLKKIIQISGIGRYLNYQVKNGPAWDSNLKKINIIYAPNGSGKTTLSTILKSLSSFDSKYVELKKTFNSEIEQYVKILTDDNSTIELKGGIWSNHNLNMEVLDILFIEDYLYSGSIHNKQNKLNLYKLLTGEKGAVLSNRFRECKNKYNTAISRLKNVRRNNITDRIEEIEENAKTATADLNNVIHQIDEIAKTVFTKHIELSNKYLLRFAPYIKFDRFEFERLDDNSKKLRLKLLIEVHGEKISFTTPTLTYTSHSAKLTLSEGDKSAIALCFFLARLELIGTTDKIIVFDDPLSSFDHGRKLTTINTLAKIAKECEQFFLLTHDLYFARDFTEKVSDSNPLNLKIENDGTTSLICSHDIYLDTLTSLEKDLQIISSYLKNEVSSDIERRDIIRCIRPALEGVLRSKYFELFSAYDWLGDMISKIRQSSSSSRLNKLKVILDDISELNDFSKSYHHSSLKTNDIINPFELKKYVTLLMETIDKI